MLTHQEYSINARVFSYKYDETVILPGNVWASYINFRLIGVGEKTVHNENVYTVVCSPEFKKAPTKDYDGLLDSTTVVMPYLDKPKLTQYVESIIKELNLRQLKTWTDYYDALRVHFSVDESEM